MEEYLLRIENPSQKDLRLANIERIHILNMYVYFGFNKNRTARELGISRETLRLKLKQYASEENGDLTHRKQ